MCVGTLFPSHRTCQVYHCSPSLRCQQHHQVLAGSFTYLCWPTKSYFTFFFSPSTSFVFSRLTSYYSLFMSYVSNQRDHIMHIFIWYISTSWLCIMLWLWNTLHCVLYSLTYKIFHVVFPWVNDDFRHKQWHGNKR